MQRTLKINDVTGQVNFPNEYIPPCSGVLSGLFDSRKNYAAVHSESASRSSFDSGRIFKFCSAIQVVKKPHAKSVSNQIKTLSFQPITSMLASSYCEFPAHFAFAFRYESSRACYWIEISPRILIGFSVFGKSLFD